MKFFKNPLRKKDETAEKPEAFAKPDKPAGPGFLSGLKDKIFSGKPAENDNAEEAFSLEGFKEKLAGMLDSRNRNHKLNTMLVITGAGIATVGLAADMMFLGGVGTITVVSCLYSDLRNAQHIRKISDELGKIDEKIDALRSAQQPVPDYAPAINAVKSSLDDFQASSRKVPPDVAAELERLKKQVSMLQGKLAPKQEGPAA